MRHTALAAARSTEPHPESAQPPLSTRSGPRPPHSQALQAQSRPVPGRLLRPECLNRLRLLSDAARPRPSPTHRRAPLRSRSRSPPAAPLRRQWTAPLAHRRKCCRSSAPARRGRARPFSAAPANRSPGPPCASACASTTLVSVSRSKLSNSAPRRPQPRRLAPASLTRTVGCLLPHPPTVPPFRPRDALGPERPPPTLRPMCNYPRRGALNATPLVRPVSPIAATCTVSPPPRLTHFSHYSRYRRLPRIAEVLHSVDTVLRNSLQSFAINVLIKENWLFVDSWFGEWHCEYRKDAS